MGFLERLIVSCVALAMMGAAPPPKYPTKPVRLIIAFTPGSATDIVGRVVAEKLSEVWGQPVVAENRPGAGGSIASNAVLQAAPDGYTLLANSSAHVVNPAIYAKLPYDTLKDFINISPLAAQPNVLIVGTDSGWKTLGNFIAAAKAKPGQLNFSSAGMGSATHLNLEKLKLMAGIDVTHIPYKGTPEAIADTMAGRVCCYFAPISAAMPHLTGGKVVALGVSTRKRSPLLPDVPAIAEAGVPNFDYNLWVGLWAPRGTPAQLVNKINKDVQQVLTSPDLKDRFVKLGAEPMLMSPADFTQFVRREIGESQKIVKAAGIPPQ
jgi:tripartite-type tricarboxylate transporter receptor subunit TctC